MVKIKVYVEGGGNKKTTSSACRRGFMRFIEKSGLQGNMPEFVAGGSRTNAFSRFAKRSKDAANESEYALLLVDAEEPVRKPGPWQHLKDRDDWDRPDGAKDDQCHLMVQAMESWFLADRTALGEYYGQGFQANALPRNPEIEEVPKKDVDDGIRRAARNTRKGTYDKGRHSFEILAIIDPTKVTSASPHAKRFINVLMGLAEERSVF